MSTPGVVNYPTSLDDAVSLIQHNNNASAPLSSGINNSVLLIPVTTPSEFSNSGFVTIVDSLINPTVIEIVVYTSKSGSDLVVPPGGRGAQGTTPAAFSAGAVVEQRATARSFSVLADAIMAMQAAIQRNMYADYNSNTTVANTTTETALLGAADDGSTKTITPALARVGITFKLSFSGVLGTTGSPTLTVRLKLGSVTIETYTATVTSTGGSWELDLFATITAIGASGSITTHPAEFEYAAGTPGALQSIGRNAAATTIDFTVSQTWELTVEWGTAHASNTFTYRFGNIDILR